MKEYKQEQRFSAVIGPHQCSVTETDHRKVGMKKEGKFAKQNSFQISQKMFHI